jgi:hypothetical protein
MTSLASQQGLNKLSFAGANRSSRGVRIDAQDKERGEEFKERGGLMGSIWQTGAENVWWSRGSKEIRYATKSIGC